MDNARKHHEKLCKQIDLRLGKGKANEILQGIDIPTGEESSDETFEYATKITMKLEEAVAQDDLIAIREECACIKANKYSAYNKKYFPQIREKHPDNDEEYLKAVAEFLNGRGRTGKYVEYTDGKIICRFGFGNKCVCCVSRGGWEKPPSIKWCRCCQGTIKSILKYVFPDKKCNMDIIETFATGGADCVFSASYSNG